MQPGDIDVVQLQLVAHLGPAIDRVKILMNDRRIHPVLPTVVVAVPHRIFGEVLGPLVNLFRLRMHLGKKLLERACIPILILLALRLLGNHFFHVYLGHMGC